MCLRIPLTRVLIRILRLTLDLLLAHPRVDTLAVAIKPLGDVGDARDLRALHVARVRVELLTNVIKFAREFALFGREPLQFVPRQLVRFERKLELYGTVFRTAYGQNCSGGLQDG